MNDNRIAKIISALLSLATIVAIGLKFIGVIGFPWIEILAPWMAVTCVVNMCEIILAFID